MPSTSPALGAASSRPSDELRTLIPGLNLDVALEPDRRRGAVRLSAGTQDTDEAALFGYAPQSFVPRLPWRSPTDEEWETLTRPEKARSADLAGIDQPGDRVAVIPVPESVLESFARLRELSRRDGDLKRLRALLDDATGRLAMVEAARFALSLAFPDRTDLDAPNAHPKIPPGTPTMTTGRDGLLTGLHIDSWYRRELDDRASSPNRVSINLGTQDRHLLFVNLPLREIAERVAKARGGEWVEDISFQLPREFARLFPEYPVVKLRVAPGEAYIAPTENVIHDGYAERIGGIDLQFTCRGYFRAGPPSWTNI